ncbi:MAG: restriction endonuclease subunit S, partial [Bacteroidetes bacterium]|nr:restriction endonuclease subunit S [Bacteroidota bacterium]
MDNNFYYWTILKKKKEIEGLGSTGKRNRLEVLRVLKVHLPSPTQRRIASVLSAYDDLIENNLKRIKLLEEKA